MYEGFVDFSSPAKFDNRGNLVTPVPVRQAATIPMGHGGEHEEDDIPLPGIKNSGYKKVEDTLVPTQYSHTICWNPRKDEMINMADPSFERQQFIKKLEDPRRQYLSRYSQIRDVLCTQRFRSPEYERKVPANCVQKTNPMNYGQGAPMFANPPSKVIQPGQSVRTVMQPDSLKQYVGASRGPCNTGQAWDPITAQCQQPPALGTQTF